MILSCIDHRCTNDIVHNITRIIGEKEEIAQERYDHFILAGASLGVVQKTFPAWRETFWQHLFLARALHKGIKTLVLLDHQECGAYKAAFPTYTDSDASALALHQQVTSKLEAMVKKKVPGLKVERWLLTKDGAGWTPHDLSAPPPRPARARKP